MVMFVGVQAVAADVVTQRQSGQLALDVEGVIAIGRAADPKCRTFPAPLSMISLPPSITVSVRMGSGAWSAMLWGAGPQSKLLRPPCACWRRCRPNHARWCAVGGSGNSLARATDDSLSRGTLQPTDIKCRRR
jgi:hypothetical protein